MICEAFPPAGEVGALRPGMFAKYLPEFGWMPYVFTRESPDLSPPTQVIGGLPDESRIRRLAYTMEEEGRAARSRRFLDRLRHIVRIEEVGGFLERAMPEAVGWSRDLAFDAIWATSPALFNLRIAREIARIRNVPWLADFRDIDEQFWTPEWPMRLRIWHLRLRLRRRLLLRSASATVAVSSLHADILARQTRHKVHVIPNGFDPAMFPSNPRHYSQRFSLVYMGRILNTRIREPRPLFAALDTILHSGALRPADLDVLFYGTEASMISELARPFKCRDLLHVLPRIPYQEVPSTLRKACVLLTLTNRGSRGILTTKTYEYLGARRPILCVPGDGGELDGLISRTSAGESCATVGAIAETLLRWYREWRATGTVLFRGREQEIAKYSRRAQAAKLAGILDALVRVDGGMPWREES